MSHPMLKVAYRRGRAAAVSELPEEDRVLVKEAISWRGAWRAMRGMLNPAELVQPGGGAIMADSARSAIRQAAKRGMGLTTQAVRNAGLLSAAGKAGAGAGIGALASEEGQRERGAILGAITGLGAHAGMHYGGGASIAKRLRALGARAGALVQKGELAPSQVQGWAKQQLESGMRHHGQIRNRIGQALFGTAGGVGAAAAAPRLMPEEQPGWPTNAGFRPNYRADAL